MVTPHCCCALHHNWSICAWIHQSWLPSGRFLSLPGPKWRAWGLPCQWLMVYQGLPHYPQDWPTTGLCTTYGLVQCMFWFIYYFTLLTSILVVMIKTPLHWRQLELTWKPKCYIFKVPGSCYIFLPWKPKCFISLIHYALILSPLPICVHVHDLYQWPVLPLHTIRILVSKIFQYTSCWLSMLWI